MKGKSCYYKEKTVGPLQRSDGGLGSELLHEVGHGHRLAATQMGGAEAVVEDAGHELANLVAQALAVPFVEVLLVLVLILEAQLEVVGLPPRSRHVGIALGARDDEVALGLHAEAKLERAHGVGVLDDALGVDVDAVLELRIEAHVGMVGAEQADDGQKRIGPHLVHGATGLLGVELAQRGVAPHLRLGGFDIDDLADESALDEGDEVVEGRAEGGLVGFEEHQLAILGQLIEFAGLVATEHQRGLAEHVATLLQGIARLLVVAEVGRGDIDGIDIGHQGLVALVDMGEVVVLRQAVGMVGHEVVDARHLDGIDEVALGHKAAGDAACTDNTDAHHLALLLAELGGGDALRAGQIDHLAVLAEVVEMAFPVGAHGEDVDIVLLDVVDFLTHIVLDDDLIGQARGPDGLNALEHVVADVELATLAIEIVVGDSHDEVVAQRLRPPQQVDVALVQQVVSAVSDDFFHRGKALRAVQSSMSLRDGLRRFARFKVQCRYATVQSSRRGAPSSFSTSLRKRTDGRQA